MNKAVELITVWGAFNEKHPNGDIEEFCRYYLTHKRENIENTSPGKFMPTSPDGMLMRLIGRIFKLHTLYTAKIMEGIGINTIDEYSLLNTIQQLNEPRKTEAIYAALLELSTGTDMLNRLKKQGYISETEDKEDKRSKRLQVTSKGDKVLINSRKRVSQLATMMFHDVSVDDKRLCFQLLKSVDTKFAGSWQSHKGKSFEEIYAEVVKEPEE
jgi:DNA-binding MarR family transcriptional regulator